MVNTAIDTVPVTVFVDEDMQGRQNLNAVMTMVDAKHIQDHWDANEAQLLEDFRACLA